MNLHLSKNNFIKVLLYSLLSSYVFSVDLSVSDASVDSPVFFFLQNLFSMKPFTVTESFLLLFLLLFYYFFYSHSFSIRNVFITVPSVLLSLFLYLGQRIEQDTTIRFSHGVVNGESFKILLYIGCCTLLFSHITALLFHWFDKFSDFETGHRVNGFFSSHTLLKCFLILVVAYVPYTIASYPAIFTHDECNQILTSFPELGVVRPPYLVGHLMNDKVLINQHHPVFHTLLMTGILKLGLSLFHSANVGIFLYCYLQMLFVFWSISYFLQVAVSAFHWKDSLIATVLAYFILSPRVHNYMMITTKDVLYAACLLFFITTLFQLFTSPEKKVYLYNAFSALGLFFTRNEAKYLLLVYFLLVLCICRKQAWKYAVSGAVATICMTVLFSSIIYPLFSITPGSRREMLSVPFQQTARYIVEHPEEVTEEEKDAISGVLDYEKLAENYNPNVADPVKDTFREDASSDELNAYFHAWYRMFLKHPRTYLFASAYNYYQYIYPGSTYMIDHSYQFSQNEFDWINPYLEPLGFAFSYPEKLNSYRTSYELARKTFEKVFPVNLSLVSATYTWTLLLFLFYVWKKKDSRKFLFLCYPLGIFLMCFLGPCNAFFGRYLYPILLVFPALFLVLLPWKEKQNHG